MFLKKIHATFKADQQTNFRFMIQPPQIKMYQIKILNVEIDSAYYTYIGPTVSTTVLIS